MLALAVVSRDSSPLAAQRASAKVAERVGKLSLRENFTHAFVTHTIAPFAPLRNTTGSVVLKMV
jgi:hypothetical protein